MKLMVQLAGTSGSGKSTPLKDMWDVSTDKVFITDPENEKRIDATWFRDMNVVVVGKYTTDCGGCDSVTGHGGLAKANSIVKSLLYREDMENTILFFEGLLMASYVNIRKLKVIADEAGVPYTIVHCDPEEQVCIDRVSIRNGGKQIKNTGSLIGRHGGLRNTTIPKLKEDGDIRVIVWHNDDCPRGDVVHTLFELLEGHVIGEN